MKIVSFILSVYIAILSTVVYCPDICMDEHEIQIEQTGENSSHDCSDCCSPFMVCNICAGFTIETFVYAIVKPQEILMENDVYPSPIYTSPFLNGIWQPPESV